MFTIVSESATWGSYTNKWEAIRECNAMNREQEKFNGESPYWIVESD